MNTDYEKTIYKYCDACTLDYNMSIEVKKEYCYFPYEILIESLIEIYFEVPCLCIVI